MEGEGVEPRKIGGGAVEARRRLGDGGRLREYWTNMEVQNE